MPFTSLEVMDELDQEAASQVEHRQEPGFRQALDDLVAVHTGLLRAARFRSNDGSIDSVCMLQNLYAFGSRDMCRDWMEPYSYSGTDDVDTLIRGQAMYLTILVVGRYDELRAFTRLVGQWRQDLERLGRISRHFDAVAIELHRDDFKKCLTTIEKLREDLQRNDPAAAAETRAAALCEEAAKAASTAREATVNDAPLDPALLVELAQRVHSRVFSNETQTEFPLALTTDFVATNNVLDPATQGFTGVSKLPFTSPQLETLDDHLVHWFSQYTARQAFAKAVAKLQRKLGIEPV